jgi:3-deoxy-D-manno-octulosonic-acid transferase
LIALHFFYQLSIRLYVLVINIASMFNHKAKLWVSGRREWKKKLQAWRQNNTGELIWVHCASLGEFEQGRPVIEAIRENYPEKKILLTFFSPSGYEIRKNYAHADLVIYLPADTIRNASTFIKTLQPTLVLFVKYEYWANYFFTLKKEGIPLYIISGILRPEQRFFGVFSSYWKKVLACVTHFYVQDSQTAELLQGVGIDHVTIAGDTRFDRVARIPEQSQPASMSKFKSYCSDRFVLVAGSTWPEEDALLEIWRKDKRYDQDGLIIIPHETDEEHIQQICRRFARSVRWTQITGEIPRESVLVIDTIGMLSFIYQYADLVLIGGGFGKGIHNTLEAATWGVPILFGPRHEKFREALGLLSVGGAYTFQNQAGFLEIVEKLRVDASLREKSGHQAKKFVEENTGATTVIMNGIRSYFP